MLEMVRSVTQAKFGDSGFQMTQMEALRVTCNMTVAHCAGANI